MKSSRPSPSISATAIPRVDEGKVNDKTPLKCPLPSPNEICKPTSGRGSVNTRSTKPSPFTSAAVNQRALQRVLAEILNVPSPFPSAIYPGVMARSGFPSPLKSATVIPRTLMPGANAAQRPGTNVPSPLPSSTQTSPTMGSGTTARSTSPSPLKSAAASAAMCVPPA